MMLITESKSDKAIRLRFAAAVYAAMEEKEWTMKKLSEEWDVNYTHLHNVVTGKKPLTLNLLAAAGKEGNDLNHIINGRKTTTQKRYLKAS